MKAGYKIIKKLENFDEVNKEYLIEKDKKYYILKKIFKRIVKKK